MRQATLGTALSGLWARSLTIKATIQVQVTGDLNAPTWVDALVDFPLLLEEAEQYARQATSELYTHPLTHVAYCRDAEELVIGCLVLETHVLRENRTWDGIGAADARELLVMGIERISGVPEPLDEVRLDLWERTATRGRDHA